MTNPLDVRYFSQDGAAFMVVAAFCLGLVIGAVVMETWGDRAASRPRPPAVRPVATLKAAPRHRAPTALPRGQGGMSGGGHPQPVRIDVRA